MQREPLKDRALGRWPGILAAIGIPSRALSNRHGPCPLCDGGKDRFRFDDKGGRGTWICSKCGAGDGIELVKRFLGVEFKDAATEIEKHIGEAALVRPATASNDDQKRKAMRALWDRSQPIALDDLAGRYLYERCGLTEFPSTLRFSKDERYGPGQFWPAMIAKVSPSDAALENGERAALHRTFLDPMGGKAKVDAPRKMMGSMPSGAAVRLMPHDDVLGIAEGIETAFAASAIFNVPVWAALTAGLLQEWTPPAGVRTVFIFGDNDHSMTGQAAAFVLAARLKAKGLDVIVELPPLLGMDWDDVRCRELQAA